MVTNQNAAGYSLADFKFALRARWTSVVLVGSILLAGGAYLTIKKPVSYQVSSRLAFVEKPGEAPVYRTITDVRPITPTVRTQARAELMSGVLFLKVIDKYGLMQRWNLKNRPDTLKKMKRLVSVVLHSGGRNGRDHRTRHHSRRWSDAGQCDRG